MPMMYQPMLEEEEEEEDEEPDEIVGYNSILSFTVEVLHAKMYFEPLYGV